MGFFAFTSKDMPIEQTCSSSCEAGEVRPMDKSTYDPVFGEKPAAGAGETGFKNLGWIGAIALMIKTQVGLGVLSIPSVFNTMGMIPGVLCLFAVIAMATGCAINLAAFKRNHPRVYGVDSALELMFGRMGRVLFGVVFTLFWICISSASMIATSTALNALTDHATCTMVFVVVAAVVGFILGSVRTLDQFTWLAWVGLTSIISSIFVLTIAVAVQDQPATSDYQQIKSSTPADVFAAISSLVFATSGTSAYAVFMSEMREPQKFTRSLIGCQTTITVTYMVIGIVVYFFCGSHVASPALGSAGPLMKTVCYGIALPGLLITTGIMTHIPSKYLFVSMLRDKPDLTNGSFKHWYTWIGSTLGASALAFVIAGSIPGFGNLVSLVGAFFGPIVSIIPMGCMWLYDNWKKDRTTAWLFKAGWSIFITVAGTFLMIAGTYSSIVVIINTEHVTGASGPWSCADNSRTSY